MGKLHTCASFTNNWPKPAGRSHTRTHTNVQTSKQAQNNQVTNKKQTSKHLHWLLMTQQRPSLDYKAQCRRCKLNLSGESISIFCLEKCITALDLVPPYPIFAIRIIKGVTEEVLLNGTVSDIHRVFKVVLLGNSAPCAGGTVDL